MCAKKQSDALSTVTDLISGIKNQKAPRHRHNRPLAENAVKEPKRKAQNHSSNELKKYIKDYDRSQTLDFADVLTHNFPLTLRGEDKENVIQKEIDFAKSLLGSSCNSVMSDDVSSLTTEDLLMIDPSTMAGFEKLEKTSLSQGYKVESRLNPVLKSTSRSLTSDKLASMHYSDIISNNKSCRKQFRSSTDSDSTMETDSSMLDIFSLNGMHYTPHSVKYRSILAEDSHREQYPSKSDTMFQLEKSSGPLSFGTPPATSSNNLHLNAGRTPYRSQRSRYKHLSYETVSSSEESEGQWSQGDTTTASCSHYSVPIKVNGQTPRMTNFIRECLDFDVNSSPAPSGSVETLKNMLFMLQSISSDSAAKDEFFSSGQDVSPDGPSSLKRAISHLSNLRDMLS